MVPIDRETHKALPGIEQVDAELRELSTARLESIAEDAPCGAPSLFTLAEWRGRRASNELARRRHEAEQAAERQATRDAAAARAEQQQRAAVAAYRQQARAVFPGTDAQFESLWPKLLERWQIAETEAGRDALREQKRRQIGGSL